MSKPCEVCQSIFKNEIEKRMIQNCNLKQLSNEYNIPYDSIYNHSTQHLPHDLAEVYIKKELTFKHNLMNELEEVLMSAKMIYQRNMDAGKDIVAIKGLTEVRGVLELLSKIMVANHQAKVIELTIIQEQNKDVEEDRLKEYSEGLKSLTGKEIKEFTRLINKIYGKSGKPLIFSPDDILSY